MTQLTLTDPKTVDGEPFEVAHDAGKQTELALEITLEALEGFRWAARGAWMSAEFHRTGTMPKGEAFDATPTGRKLYQSYEAVTNTLKTQRTLTAAAAWNPKEV